MRTTSTHHLDVETAVSERYSTGAREQAADLCCPVDYDPNLLEALPDEILERDYGCGDPSRFVHEGDVVLDLGSGAGKICYIASQVTGAAGRVIGIDMNADMLAVARLHQADIARRIGHDNVSFHRGRIQDLAIDLDVVDGLLEQYPVRNTTDLAALERRLEHLRSAAPMIADCTIDIVLSNCVLNLVKPEDKAQLFSEIHRVLKTGGRAAISDIVCDEAVPAHMLADPELWSGCIAGAYEELAFLEAFRHAGFQGIEMAKRDSEPWRVVEGIEFRSVTVVAHKAPEGACMEHRQAVVYRGPFSQVRDDDGHLFRRGVRSAVCGKTYDWLRNGPFAPYFYFIDPRVAIGAAQARPFDCSRTAPRHPRETKGQEYDITTEARECCPDEDCC